MMMLQRMAVAEKTVLYVEDEESDAFLMRMAFRKEGLESCFRTVSDGRAAMDYLSGAGLFNDRDKHPIPAVVLLDLNLPGVHGFEVLKWIRAHPAHKEMPVIIFSSSMQEVERALAKALGATQFVQKPHTPALFREVVKNLVQQFGNQIAPTNTETKNPGSQ